MGQTNRIALLQRAEDAARKGEYGEALGIVSRCLDLYPGFSPARVLKSEVLSRTGNVDMAITELREIIASNPENIRARMILTDLLIQQNDQKQAMIHLEFLSFMIPENDPGLLDLRQRAEELQPGSFGDDEKPRTLEFGIIEEENEEGSADLLPKEMGEGEGEGGDVILKDEVTEIFTEEELNFQPETPPLPVEELEDSFLPAGEEGRGDPEISAGMDEPLEEINDGEDVGQNEVITVHVPEADVPGEGTAKDDIEIKTLTMARVYERQKMYPEALNILASLYERDPSKELSNEIQRVKSQAESSHRVGGKSRQELAIIALKNWMEKITCNSIN